MAAPPSPQAFPFLRLPLELRSRVYDICLDFTYALGLVNSNLRPPLKYSEGRVSFDWRSTPGILLCNREIHSEAIRMLCSKNFVINRGCTPHIMLGSFSKRILQRLTRVTVNIDLKQDGRLSSRLSSGPFQRLLIFLGVVWSESHSLQTLTIDVSGCMSGHRWIDTCEYLFTLFYPLREVANISNVFIRPRLDSNNATLTERTNLGFDIETYTRMLKRDKISNPQPERLSVFYLNYPALEQYDRGSSILLFPAFIRWWSLAEQGYKLTKSQDFPWGLSSTYFSRLKKAWEVHSWRCLPLAPTHEECARELDGTASPATADAEEMGWIQCLRERKRKRA